MNLEKYVGAEFSNPTAYAFEAPFQAERQDHNESPWDFPEEFKSSVLETVRHHPWNRYGEPYALAQERLLAQRLGVPADNVILTAGASGLLETFFKVFVSHKKRIAKPAHSFVLYDALARQFGVETVQLGLACEGRYDLDVLLGSRAQHFDVPMLLCSPNNPTGRGLSGQEILQIATQGEAPLLVDAVYCELQDASRQICLSHVTDNKTPLLIARSLSKGFGGAGVRVGFGIIPKQLKPVMKAATLPYQFNMLSLAFVETLCEERWWTWRERQFQLIRAERERLRRELKGLSHLNVYPSEANFLSIEVLNTSTQRAHSHLAALNVHAKCISKSHLRLTVGTPVQNERAIEAFKRLPQVLFKSSVA